ncbi:MAG: hypothetical protein QT10_C0012G0008 [archaeon GW2011_AR19]|nr:MAG: hypothetical protein QT10_C0012G0008 [archaeon GW2011_AR19]
MEQLEKVLKKVELKTKEAKLLLVEKPLYKGLLKVEESAYMGPTNIKYWM